ncbi:lytic transglycosylase domain-containing protein [Nitrospiraceae bacterium HYJII51-Mn-bac16s-1-B09]|uniref:Lytic transglycosylase domain-containing protein n=2 Tax=Candidatus Manganitrophus noduliformans TaxID=2606439 RepID=A0A7X6DMF3_9BACT|nr:lytic transglycosylase domain-containing protein [Candidatus Manganitrophus noduliformans]
MSAAERSHLNCSFKTVSDLQKKRSVVGMIGADPMSVKQRYRRYWILTGTLGFFLFHPFSSDVSLSDPHNMPLHLPADPVPHEGSAKQGSPHSEGGHFRKEKKIFEILSGFETGLDKHQEKKLASFIHQESRRYGFDPELIVAVISTESSFYNWAISPKGAVGLMQLIPTTGKEVAERNDIVWHGKDLLFDPFLNIRLGIHYLWMLYLKFGDIHIALTAYNYGPGKVVRWLKAGQKIPTNYSEKVLDYYQKFLNLGGSGKNVPEKDRPVQMARRS